MGDAVRPFSADEAGDGSVEPVPKSNLKVLEERVEGLAGCDIPEVARQRGALILARGNEIGLKPLRWELCQNPSEGMVLRRGHG